MKINLDTEKIYKSMLEGVFVEFCDLTIMYGLPILEDRYKNIDKAKKTISALQEIGRLKAHKQKKRAQDGLKEIKNANEYVIFLEGCYKELYIQLTKQLNRILTVEDSNEALKSLDNMINVEIEILKEEILKKE